MAIIAIYSGDLVGSARLISATGDPAVVRCVAELLLAVEQSDDTALDPLRSARLGALRLLTGDDDYE